MSPHSLLMASRESTTTVARFTVSLPISRFSGRWEPTALIWTPGLSHSASRIGSAASVTAVRTSAPRTTASADSCGWIGKPISSSSSSFKYIALTRDGLQMSTRSMERTRLRARMWVRAWVPAPRTPSTGVSGRASALVAMADAHAVRMAVM